MSNIPGKNKIQIHHNEKQKSGQNMLATLSDWYSSKKSFQTSLFMFFTVKSNSLTLKSQNKIPYNRNKRLVSNVNKLHKCTYLSQTFDLTKAARTHLLSQSISLNTQSHCQQLNQINCTSGMYSIVKYVLGFYALCRHMFVT